MRLATILDDGPPAGRRGRATAACLPLAPGAPARIDARDRRRRRGSARRDPRLGGRAAGRCWRPLDDVELGPAVPDPGAIYTSGSTTGPAAGADADRPERPLVYGKAPASVAGHGATLAWDRDADRQRRRGGRAGRGHRRGRRRRAARRWPRLRLHDRQRRLVARPVARRRPVAARASRCPGSARSGPWSSPPTSSTRPTCAWAARSTAIADPGRPHVADALLDRRDRSRTSAATSMLRPGDLIATGTPARLADPAGTRPPSAARRRRDRLDRGDRRAHHHHRLTQPGGHRDEAADRVPGRDDQPRGRGVPRATTRRSSCPTGSTEQHGPHGPLLTDVLVPQRGRPPRRAARRRLVAPPINYGLSYPHVGFTGVVHIRIPTFMALDRGPVRRRSPPIGLPADRVPQRPLRQHLRDRLRLRQRRRPPAGRRSAPSRSTTGTG